MAQSSAPSVQQAAGISDRLGRAEQLIDQRLEETRKRLKTTDIAVAGFLLALGICAYLFIAAVVDHWAMPLAVRLDELLLPEGTRALSYLLPALGLFEQPAPLGSGGLSAGGRLVMWVVLVAAVAGLVVWRLLPLVLFRISPVFAAYTIEQSRPSLKNSLINLLFLRREKDEFVRDELARRVFEGLEFRTAGELAQVSPDTAVDHSRVVRLGYGLLVMVAVLGLYLILSPKNPIVSMRRVMWPWAELQAPTRVTIRHVDPGDTVAYQGDTLVISAEVRGLRSDETPTLYFTTVDRQTVDEAVPMALAGTYRFQCELPPGKLGLSQSLEYFISAGDAITRTFSVEVQVPLSIAVERVEYQYPAYTGKAPETVEGTGDIKALEGTEVTLHARANQPIEKATIELNCDSRNARRMESRGQSAQVAFFLRMNPQEPTQPEYTSYQLRFVDPQGRENRRPIRYRIEVLPDLPPEVRIDGDLPEEIRLPRNGHLDVVLRAEDPDFGLRKVGIRALCQEKTLPVPPLLDLARYEKAHRGPLQGTTRIEPARLGLQVGDKVVFWAEAEDNREVATGPAPNRAETEKRLILIVPDEAPKKPPASPPPGGQKPDKAPRKAEQAPRAGQPAQPPEEPSGAEQPAGHDQPQPPGQRPEHRPEPAQDGQAPRDRNPQAPDAESKPQRPEQGTASHSAQDQAGPADQGRTQARRSPEQPGSQPRTADQQAGQEDQPSAQPSAGQKDQSDAATQAPGPGQEPSGPDQPSGSEQADASAPRQPVNSRTNPGDAIEEILRHQQEHSQEPSGPSGQDGQAGQPKPGSQRSAKTKPAPAAEGPSTEQESQPDRQPTAGEPGAQQQAKPAKAPDERRTGGRDEQDKPSATHKPSQSDHEGTKGPGQADMHAKPPSPPEKPAGDARQSPADMKPGTERTASPAGDAASAKSPDAEPHPTGHELGGSSKPAGPEKPAAGKNQKPATADKQSPSAADKQAPSAADKQGPSAAEQPKPGQASERTAMPESPEELAGPSKPGPVEPPKMMEDTPPGSQQPTAKPLPHEPGCTCETCRKGGGSGQAGRSTQAPPLPQEANQPRPDASKPAGSAAQKQPSSPEAPQSPSTSAKQSKSEGQEAGDRSGGGKQGGGQGAQEQGPGMPGSQTDAGEGGGASSQPGQGPTGSQPGEQAAADKAAGRSQAEQPGQGGRAPREHPGQSRPIPEQPNRPGAKSPAEPAAKPSESKAPDHPQPKQSTGGPSGPSGDASAAAQSPGGTPGGRTGGGAQNPQGGGLPGKGEPPPPAEPTPPRADDPILEYTRQQTNLALRHLEEEAGEARSDLLERLGWTPEQAREFIAWYRKLEQAAGKPTPEGHAARRERDAWLKSLGLRPRGTELRGGTTPADKLQDLKDPGRIPPPPKWRNQFRAFTEGLGSQRP